MEKYDFKLIGLSKPNSATLTHLNDDTHIFWATIDIPKDRFEALWKLCKNNWDDPKIAEIECTEIRDGIPVNARLVGIRFN